MFVFDGPRLLPTSITECSTGSIVRAVYGTVLEGRSNSHFGPNVHVLILGPCKRVSTTVIGIAVSSYRPLSLRSFHSVQRSELLRG